MHQRYALWLAIFPFVMLFIYFLSSVRARRSDEASNFPPDALHAAHKARFATLAGILAISVASWLVALVIYVGDIDLGEIVRPVPIRLFASLLFLIIAFVGFAFMTWKIDQFESRIKTEQITDPKFLGTLNEAKSVRWKWAGLMILFAIIIAV